MDTLPALFAAGRPSDPSTPLLITPEGEVTGYGAAERRSAQIANALGSLGVGPADRVAVQIEKSPLAVLTYLACLRAGAVFLPVNPAYTDQEVSYLVADAEPAVLLRDPARTAPLQGPVALTGDSTGAGTLADAADSQEESFDDFPAEPGDLAALLYTSGTTGRPKGAMLTHSNLASNAATLHRAWGFRGDDVLLHALPVFHAHGLFVAINCVLANGTGMVFLPRFDVDSVLEHLPRATVFMGVPTMYTRLLADRRVDQRACRRMRLFISGSAPLMASTHQEFRARTGHAILERYGMTETTMITSNPLKGERRAGTVGAPLPGIEVRIADAGTGAPLGAGEVGGIEVRGPNVFTGYWKRPELSASEFTADGFFRTGDVGSFDPDGYLRIVGRSKDVVISGGLNVYPIEVEEVLDAMDGVLESAVIGVPDADLGEAVVAVVTTEPGRELDRDALWAGARRRLASFKVPRQVHVVDALPRNAMGKIEKAKLRSRFGRT
ncbi:MAG TPA: AMP-binding protein [Acidimicrobiales bacterium]|nr:AMP-binding protein [Acidimicrobiales bacterium]